MLVLGIDPGSVVTGYGVLEHGSRKTRLVTCGCFRPKADLPFEKRLLEIYDGLMGVIAETGPQEAALEATFYGANVQTAMKMSQARGAILVALANSDLPIFEYSPREVKKAVVGRGGASKEQVEYMVRNLLGMETRPKVYDITDSLAVALCHIQRSAAFPGSGQGKKQDLAARLAAVGAFERRPNRVNEKLKALGVPAKPRRRGR